MVWRIFDTVKSAIKIQGLGLITPLGSNPVENWTAIVSGRSLVDRGTIPDALINNQEALFHNQANPMSLHAITPDRVIRLAMVAADQAIRSAGWLKNAHMDDHTALFVATSKGPILSNLAGYENLRQSGPAQINPSLAWHIVNGPATIGLIISSAFGIADAGTSVAACAGSLVAVHRAVSAITHGFCRRAVVVAADASLHPMFENSFENLGVLASPDADGHRRCQPFSTAGNGFFITEAAAAMCLENSDDTHGLILEKTWTGADATHLVGTDPLGRSLRRGLKTIAANTPVDFVHAHAAGTRSDHIERNAINDIFGDSVELFSHKQWLGHALGAAGLIGLTLSALCHQYGRTLTERTLKTPSRSVTIGQGFGGHIALCSLCSASPEVYDAC